MDISSLRKRKYLLLIPLAVLAVVAAYFAATVATWGQDESMAFRQALEFVFNGDFPYFGLFCSKGFRTPNGLPLAISPFVIIRSPYWISFVLSVAQISLIGFLFWRSVKCLRIHGSVVSLLFLVPLLLFPPCFFFFSTELWAQFVAKSLVVVVVVIFMESFMNRGRKSWLRDFVLGCLLLLLPAIHLGLVLIMPFAFVLAYFLYRRKGLNLLAFGGGCGLFFVCSWLPWGYLCLSNAFVCVLTSKSSLDISLVDRAMGSLGFLWTFFTDANNGGERRVAFAAIGDRDIVGGVYFVGIRLVTALALATLLVVRRLRSQSRGWRIVAWAVGLIACCIILISLGGVSARQDYLLLFAPSLYFLLALVGFGYSGAILRYLKRHKGLNPSYIQWGIAMAGGAVLILSGFFFRDVYQANRVPHSFRGDIPVCEKVRVLNEMSTLCRAKGRKEKVTVNLRIRNFASIFGWCYYFSNFDVQNYYRPDIFYDTYARFCAEQPVPYKFVPYSPKTIPDYVLTYPASEGGVYVRTDGSQKVFFLPRRSWMSLTLWEQTQEAVPKNTTAK